MHVITLGTGSSLPTSRRGLSATAVIREGKIILFDCGEGTQMQFQRAGLRPGKLQQICISHLHGDHLFGLPGLLTTLQMLNRTAPLFLYGPKGLTKYVNFIKKLTKFTPSYPIYLNEVDLAQERVVWDIGEIIIEARPLEHNIFVLGFSLTEKPRPGKFDVEKAKQLGIPEGPLRRMLQKGQPIKLPQGQTVSPDQVVGPPRAGKKIAYCVDTRLCNNCMELARNADLLLHDGTFAENEIEKAYETGHSTVSQAAEVAQKAGVKKLVITHISARYGEEDEETLLQSCRKIFAESYLAEDLMYIKL